MIDNLETAFDMTGNSELKNRNSDCGLTPLFSLRLVPEFFARIVEATSKIVLKPSVPRQEPALAGFELQGRRAFRTSGYPNYGWQQHNGDRCHPPGRNPGRGGQR